jgi:hypothetical protein
MRASAHAKRRSKLRPRYGLDLAALCLLVAVAAAVIAGFAWSRPTAIASSLPYRQTGQLSYGATASAKSLYGADGLSTGQPIYTDVVTAVQVTYGYRFSMSGATRLAGTEQLSATISNGQGVTQAVPLQPPTQFRSNRFSATGTLHLAALEAIAKAFNEAAGGVGAPSYAVTVSPHVALRGRLGSRRVKTSFDPAVAFLLTGTALTPTPAAPVATGTAPSALQQFRSVSNGFVERPAGQANRLLRLPVLDVRFGSLALFAVVAAALVLLVRPILEDVTSDDERVRVATRYGSSLVQVRALPEVLAVEMSSFTGLSQVARRLECPILHLQDEGDNTYAVVDNGTLYRYRAEIQHHRSRNGRVPAHASFQ